MNLTIIYVNLGEEPAYLDLENLAPEFLHEQWSYSVEQNSTLEFTVDMYDYEGDPWLIDVDL